MRPGRVEGERAHRGSKAAEGLTVDTGAVVAAATDAAT